MTGEPRAKRTVHPRPWTVVAVVIALWVLAGCDSSGSSSSTASPTPGQASSALEQLAVEACSALGDLEGDLQTVSEQGLEQGDEITRSLDSVASALQTAATRLEAANADTAASASSLASDVEALASSAGEDAQARATDAAGKVDELSSELRCSGS